MNKTLKEKRKELIQKYKKEWDIPESQKVWWDKIFIDVEKQDKELINEILSEIDKEIKEEEYCMAKDKYEEQELEHINQIEMANKIKKMIKQKAGEFKK